MSIMDGGGDIPAHMVTEALNSDTKLAKIIESIGRALYRDGKEAA
ncbi:hypothetical protein [Cryobacterium sp. Hh7]|nr:hypothetical protein [Cryobacterium sp. Hh7]